MRRDGQWRSWIGQSRRIAPLPLLLACITALAFVNVQAVTNVVSFSTTDVSVVENTGSVTVTVVRTESSAGSCSAGFKTVPGSATARRDYKAVTGRVEFVAGEIFSELTIPLFFNTVPETVRFFQVILVDFSNCVAGAVATGEVAILDAQTVPILAEGFGSGLPAGWSIITEGDGSGPWRFDNPGARTNSTGGKGAMAIADSDYAEDIFMDTEFRTPSFEVSLGGFTYLTFKSDYYRCSSEIADVDISLSGGEGPWTNLWRRQSASARGPTTALIDLTPLAKGQSNVMVRFHYYNADYDYYWQVDDVAILVEHDSNTNGLPDWWETTYYSGLTNLVTRGDSDGDGACDEDEFIAGTNPRDTNSCFRAVGLTRSNATVTVQFPAEVGHYYDLKSCTNLLNQSWTTRVARIQGMGGNTNLSLSAPGSNGFYRLDVRRW